MIINVVFVFWLIIMITTIESQIPYTEIYIGCYGIEYGAGNGLRVKLKHFHFHECLDFCRAKGTIYAGIEIRKKKCYCGNYFEENSRSFPRSSCPDQCQGSDRCGGRRKMSVYQVIGSATSPAIPAQKSKAFTVVTGNKLNWYGALVDCQTRGLRLATIDNNQEHEQVLNLIKSQDKNQESSYWLSGSDMGHTGDFVWMTTGHPLQGFTAWADHQPDTKEKSKREEHCLEMRNKYRYRWNNIDCFFKNSYICDNQNN